MRRPFSIIAVALLLCANGVALAADPFEVNPAKEQRVVDASWGDQPHEFAWRGDEWGKGEVGSFGPFCLDSDGRIYIFDELKNEVKIFGQQGGWQRSIHLNKQSNIVSGMAVYEGRIYWFGETMPIGTQTEAVRRHYLVFSVDVSGKESSYAELELSTELRLSGEHSSGAGYSNNCSLHVSASGVDLFARRGASSYPLLRSGKVVPVAEQSSGKTVGLKADGTSVVFDYETDDIVRLGPGGTVEKVLIRNAGWLWGVAGNYFLTESGESVQGQDRLYFELYNLDGELISRTRMPDRDSARRIEIAGHARALQLNPDGSWHEMYVDDLGVHVSRYTR